MTEKRADEPKVEEKIASYRSFLAGGEEGQERPWMARLAEELDEDPSFAEKFFEKLRAMGESLPKGLLAELMPLLSTKEAQKAPEL